MRRARGRGRVFRGGGETKESEVERRAGGGAAAWGYHMRRSSRAGVRGDETHESGQVSGVVDAARRRGGARALDGRSHVELRAVHARFVRIAREAVRCV